MSRKSKNRTRSQGGKSAVVIPAIPELDEHANAIRMLGRRSFDDLVEIGQRVARCRALLKAKRVWLAWIKLEFGWSRAHADNLIAIHANRRKLQKFSTLPVSALYLLAKASDKLTEKIAQDIAAGERPLVRDIKQQARAKRAAAKPAAITTLPRPSGQSGVRMNITSQEEPRSARAPTQIGSISPEIGPFQAAMWLDQCQTFWAWLDGQPPDKVVATLPAEKHRQALEVLDRLGTLVKEFQQRFWDAGRSSAGWQGRVRFSTTTKQLAIFSVPAQSRPKSLDNFGRPLERDPIGSPLMRFPSGVRTR